MPTFARHPSTASAEPDTATSASASKFTTNDWIEFLVRIPAIDVVKLRILSKFHRDLIDSPDFVGKHTDQSNKSPLTHVILSQRTSTDNQTVDYCVRFDSTDIGSDSNVWTRKDTYFDLKLNLMKGPSVAKKGYSVAGSCRGILCLTHSPNKGHHHIILWNPITRDSRTFMSEHDDLYPFFTYYLGYDAVTDDFKVLKISHKHNQDSKNKHYEYVCEVYSSRNGSWTKVNKKNHNKATLINLRRGVFLEGTNSLHFMVNNPSREYIAAFDFSNEKFRQIQLPEQGSWAHELHCVSRRLCFSQYGQDCFSVWMMEEYGAVESWNRVLTLNTGSLLQLDPVELLNDGRHLLVLTRLPSQEEPEIRLRFYDCVEKELMEENRISLTPPKSADAHSFPMRFLYTPSLTQL